MELMLKDFNLLATTMRGNERDLCYELAHLLEQTGDPTPNIRRTGISGLVAAKTSLDPFEVIEKLREILNERPYEFRFAFRIIPIEKVVRTGINEILQTSAELGSRIGENETFRVTVEKRFTQLSSQELIKAVAADINRKVDLSNPNKIMLVEIVGGWTGISLIKPDGTLSVLKEKML